ncbi:unnamed protein product [Linum trigynum]|uniref:Glycosyltransferase n=1 Tax=Linum trigynum TaxID=586398 RepID=A0AAV2GB74_9ROSI
MERASWSTKSGKGKRPHVIVVPYPAQGHINPMLQFSKRLISRGVKATLATTVFVAKSMHLNQTSTTISVESFSDGFDQGGFGQAASDEDYVATFRAVGSRTLTHLIQRLSIDSDHDHNDRDPVTAVIYDGFMPWALDVAKDLGLVGAVFFTQSCAVNSVYFHVQRGLLPLPLTESTVSLPGLPVLKASETPSYVSDYGSYPAIYQMVVDQFTNVDQADYVLFDCFYEMEKQVVDWMARRWRVGTIGPTLPSKYLDGRLEDDTDYVINLFEPSSDECMSWLGTKPEGSVVYASFGSMVKVSQEQMEEVARGLENTNFYFLWVVRADEEVKLPANFNRAGGKGLVVNWAPQLEVLAHPATGCFLTHCGLNSVVEAMCLGVPMVAVPQWTDQITNAKYVEDVWQVGVRVAVDGKATVRRETVEMCIREVMEVRRVELKVNAESWKGLARQALDGGGSSDLCINDFVAALL